MEEYMYNVYRGDTVIAQVTPGGPGCNNLYGTVVDVANPPEEIKAEELGLILRLNKLYKPEEV